MPSRSRIEPLDYIVNERWFKGYQDVRLSTLSVRLNTARGRAQLLLFLLDTGRRVCVLGNHLPLQLLIKLLSLVQFFNSRESVVRAFRRRTLFQVFVRPSAFHFPSRFAPTCRGNLLRNFYTPLPTLPTLYLQSLNLCLSVLPLVRISNLFRI